MMYLYLPLVVGTVCVIIAVDVGVKVPAIDIFTK